ncbi:MAG: phosphatidate cytidylyltransferase [Rickettsiales bacterium]
MVSKNMLVRIATSLVLAPLVLTIIYFNNIIFDFMMFSLAGIMFYEWYELTVKNNHQSPVKWKLVGILYVGLPCTALIWIIDQSNGHIVVLWILMVVWATDTFAYFFGKLIGGPKLAPRISPNKTWSGLIGGISGAALVGFFMKDYLFKQDHLLFISLNIILAIYAQIGDLIESWVKRRFNFKDSGSIIPGHGGILDRVDGLTIVAPKIALLLMLDNSHYFL